MLKVNFQLKDPAPPPPPPQVAQDFTAWFASLINLIEGSVQGEVLMGKDSGAVAPTSDIGPWLNGNTWYNWSEPDQQYLPVPLATGRLDRASGTVKATQIISKAQDGNINLRLPDDPNATLATIEDLNAITAGLGMTKSLSGTLFSVEWGNRYQLNPQASFGIKEIGTGEDGGKIDLWIFIPPGTASPFNITWPSKWIISSGALPITSAGIYKVAHVEVNNLGGFKLVDFKSSFTFGSGALPPDTTPPTVTDNNVVVGTNQILILTDEVLKGGDIPIGDFTVTRNGDDNPVLAAKANGALVTLTVRDPYISGNTGDITYAGTDIKDVAGNTMAGFNLPTVNIVAMSHVTVLRGRLDAGALLTHQPTT